MFSCYLASGGCPIMLGLAVLGWVLVASVLLYLSWNKVIVSVTNFKAAKLWHALLIVVTMLAFCAPKYMMHKGYRGHHKGCAAHSSSCVCAKSDCSDCGSERSKACGNCPDCAKADHGKKSSCPHAHGGDDSSDEAN